MSAGQAKLQLVLELKNRIKSGLSSARQTLQSGMSSMKQKMMEFRNGASDMLSSIGDSIPGLGNIGMLANPYALVTAGAIALATAYGGSVKMAADWEKGMAKVNVTAQLNKKELAALSGEVLKIAGRNYTPLEEAPEAFNKVVSAGLDAKTALREFDPILKAAKAGFTDVETVAAATVATMNSTGWRSATSVLDVLFATMNKGNAEFADISNYLPKIIPMAQKAGQSFQDTAGAFAYLTAQGFKAEAASTGLQNVMKAISDPRITDGFKKVGINIYDATGKSKPLLTIIRDLDTKLKGMSDKGKAGVFQTIGMDAEATTAIGSMLKDYEKLATIIKFTNASQGQLNEALKNSETPMDVWMIVSNQVKMAMIGIGQTGLPIIKTIGQYVLNTIQYFKTLWAESALFRDIIGGIGTVVSVAFTLAMRGPLMLWNLLKHIGGTISWLAQYVGLGTGSFTSMYNTVRPYLMYMWEMLSKIGDIAYKISALDFSGAWKGIKGFKAPNLEQLRKQSLKDIVAHREKTKKPDSPFDPTAPFDPTKPTKDKTLSSDVSKVTGSAQQIKNLTINMDAMVKMGDFVSKNPEVANMSKRELEQWFTELCARMLRNLETSYS